MESNYFASRVLDTFNAAERGNTPKFLGFLTESEAAMANLILKKQNAHFSFFGGYPQAERVYLACLPEWCESPDFPIASITFSFRREDRLTHRDFLGSLMALGLTREKIGDILVEEGRAVIFAASSITEHILSQIEKVGRVGVTLDKGYTKPLPTLSVLKDFSLTVSSLRLDCVIAAICGCSRTQSAQLINSGLVSINSIPCEKITQSVTSGEKITVKGKGKFIIDDTSDLSKKGKIILKYKKYV